MRPTPTVALLLLLGATALANPIAVREGTVHKERAVVRIVADRDGADFTGSFVFRRDSDGAGGLQQFGIAVPAFVPAGASFPGMRYTNSSQTGRMDECLKSGGWSPRIEQSLLPTEYRRTLTVVTCFLNVFPGPAGEVPVRLEYRQAHARVGWTSSTRIIYVPVFEEWLRGRLDTAADPDRFRVDIEATPGISLRLISANTILARSPTSIRVAPIDRQAIVVEVVEALPAPRAHR